MGSNPISTSQKRLSANWACEDLSSSGFDAQGPLAHARKGTGRPSVDRVIWGQDNESPGEYTVTLSVDG